MKTFTIPLRASLHYCLGKIYIFCISGNNRKWPLWDVYPKRLFILIFYHFAPPKTHRIVKCVPNKHLKQFKITQIPLFFIFISLFLSQVAELIMVVHIELSSCVAYKCTQHDIITTIKVPSKDTNLFLLARRTTSTESEFSCVVKWEGNVYIFCGIDANIK